MLLTIHDANLRKIGFIDNEKQETLNFYDDTWTPNLETASSTFEFTVSKKELLSDTGNKHLYNQLNERSFVSFKHKGKTYLFNIMKVEENERWLRCYCENLNLELINEYTNPYKAARAMSFAEYLDVFEIPRFAMVTLGVNEISDQKRTLEWEGQETKLARLLSLANKFDAEVEFITRLNDDSSINQLVLNVYHKADDLHTGVGRIRGDIRLTFEKNIKSMTRKVDKTDIYTMVIPYGKSKETHEGEQEVGVYIDSLPPWEERNDEGIVIFKQEGINLYAPHAADLYPSTFGVSTQANKWIRKDLEVNSDDPNVIRAAGIANLRKHAYPAITYEVDGFLDVEVGDTVTIHDKGFTPPIDVRARVIEQKISFSNPENNKTVFGNFKELENRTSADLRSVFERMVENSRPYTIMVSTDNGVLFKNNTGQSTIRPTLKRGNQSINATYRFVIDGSIVGAGLTYTVRASDITKPTVVTVSAWVDDKEVASEELTFLNVSDGKQGPKGDRGNDGLPGKDGVGLKTTTIVYGISDNDTTPPSNWSSQPPTLVKGKYLWTKTVWTYTDNTTETGYQKTYIAKDGNDGNDGLPGKDGVGIKETTITYAAGTSGTTTPATGWDSQVPKVPAGQFLWTKTVWTYTDNTNETGYSVSRIGENGIGILKTWNFYKLSNSTTAPQIAPTGVSTNLGHLGPNNAWAPYTVLNSNTNGYNVVDVDKIAKSNIIPDKPFTWYLVASFDGVSNFNGSTSFNIRFENWYTNSAGSPVFNALGTRDLTASNFSATNDTAVNNYFSQSVSWTVPKDVYDAIPDGGYLNLRIRIDGFSKLSYHAKISYVTYGTVPSDDSKKGLGNYSTYGWQPTPGVVTQSLPYLWFYQIQFYDNGKEVAIPPTIIGSQGNQGIQGPKGADGRTQYTHLAYADTVSGSGFSLTDQTKAYIGMYQDFNPTNSQNPQDYRWSKWKGSDGKDGIPGKPGADGRTPYVHFAYADSADGQTGFSLTQTGNKRYLGVLTDFNQADSTNPADYTWSDTAGSITVGGDNLVRNSALPQNLDNWSLWYPSQPTSALSVATHPSYYNGAKSLFLLKATSSSMVPASTAYLPVKRNTDYSFNIQLLASNNIWGVDIFVLGRKSNETDQVNTKAFSIKDYNGSPSSGGFVKWHITFNSGDLDEVFIRIDNKGSNNSSEALLYFTEVDCYEGTTDRVWQASPKDLKDEIDGKADNVLTQAQLNKLNETNSVLKAELDAKASLATVNQWIKDYQDLVNANNADRAQAERRLADTSARVVKLENNLNDMAERWNFIDSYMSTSNDGLVIGKKDNSSSIMFNPDGRISMFSAGNEVMYISQGVIHIENGIFSKTIQIGRFREEQDSINPDRNVIRYVGGI